MTKPKQPYRTTLRARLRAAQTVAAARYGVGGRLKEHRVPRPITLPKIGVAK